MIVDTKKLVNAKGLLEALFEPNSRPCVRWLWQQTKKRNVPYIKIGHRVFFDPDRVREALEKKKMVRARL